MVTSIRDLMVKQRSVQSSFTKELEKLRLEVIQLHDERYQVEMAPVPLEEAVRNLQRWLDREREKGEINLWGLMANERDARDPQLSSRSDGDWAAQVVFGMMICAVPEQIEAALTENLKHRYDKFEEAGRKTYSAAAQKKRLSEIDQRRRVLEISEETIIREAEKAGLGILRREDASPEIVLLPDEELAA